MLGIKSKSKYNTHIAVACYKGLETSRREESEI
jgi:hypothetical protein